MTQLPPSDNFSKYYQDYLKQLGGSAGVRREIEPLGIASPNPRPNEMSFLGRTIDILSRPLYAVTNLTMKGLESPEKFKALEEREAAGEEISVGERLSPIGAVLAAPFTGFFSDADENKNLGSDLIEQFSDTVNLNNPNYVDVDDNVNPVVKGVGGFAVDVAADPLTWLPITWVAKGLQIAGRGAEKAFNALKPAKETNAIEELTKLSEKAPINNIGDATKVVDSPAQAVLATDNRIRSFIDRGVEPGKAFTSAFADTVRRKKYTVGKREDLGVANAASKWLTNNMKDLDVTDITIPTRLLDEEDWADELVNLADQNKLESVPINLTELDGVKFERGTLQDFADSLKTFEDSASQKQVNAWYERNNDTIREQIFGPLYTRFTENFGSSPTINMFGDDITPRTLTGAAAAVARISKMSAAEFENARRIFGTQLANRLRQMDEVEFARFEDNAQMALARNGVVEAMGKITGDMPERLLLNRFGIRLADYERARLDMDERIGELIRGETYDNLRQFADDLENNESLQAYVTALLGDLDSPQKRFRFNGLSVAEDMVGGIASVGREVFGRLSGKLSRSVDKAGKVKPVDPTKATGFSTDEQVSSWINLSKFWSEKFRGKPLRDEQNNIIKDSKNNVQYEEIPKYIQFTKGENAVAYFGFDLGELLEDTIVNSARIMDDVASSQGLSVNLTKTFGRGTAVTEMLRMSDIYEVTKRTLAKSFGLNGERMLRTVMFNGTTAMPVNLLIEAALAMRTSASKNLTVGLVRESLISILRRDVAGNWLAQGKSGKFGFVPTRGKPNDVPKQGLTWVPKEDSKGKLVGYWAVWDPEILAGHLADALIAGKPMLDEVIEIRRAQYTARGAIDFETTAAAIARELYDLFSKPENQAAGILASNNLGRVIGDFVRGLKVNELGEVYTAGALDAAIPSQVRAAARASEEITEAIRRGDNKAKFEAKDRAVDADDAELNKIREDALNSTEPENLARVEDPEFRYGMGEDGTTIRAYELADEVFEAPADAGIRYTMMRFLKPLNGRYMMDAVNRPKSYVDFIALGVASRKYGELVGKKIRFLAEKYPGFVDGETSYLQAAFRNLQNYQRWEDETDEVLKAAMKDLNEAISDVVNVNRNLRTTLLATSFGRSGPTIAKLNKLFEKHAVLGRVESTRMARLPESGSFIDINKAVADAKASNGEIDELTAALEQWRDWNVTNPLEFLASMHGAMFDLANESAFIDRFFNYMKKINFATTDPAVARANGFVRLTVDGKSHFGDMVPDNFYLAPEAADVFKAMDINLRTTRTLTSDFGKFVTDYIDPVTQKLKYTMTVIRVGHHIRNLIGNASMQFIALGARNFMKAQNLSYQVMLKLRGTYQDVDVLKGLTQTGETIMDDGASVVSFNFRGKKETLTLRQVYALAERYLLDTGAVSEDIFNEAGKMGFQKFVENASRVATFGLGAQGGGLERLAFGASEFVEHQGRISHFVQALLLMADGKPMVRGIGKIAKPKNMEEAIHYAVQSAIKYHPNSATLTPQEARYGRRAFLFYSWVKQASVALAEASVMHPARTWTLFPKASYNIAVAMGLTPESLGDPFPEDQLFPSYLRDDMLGPQARFGDRYIALSPGIASVDVFNDLLANPVEGVVSGTNPVFRIPLELLAGARLGSQAPIRDLSDYIDSSIPGINYGSNFTGRSLSTLGIQEQAKVASGAKTSFDQWLSFFNYVTGLGARNYSRQDIINYAEIEARNEAANQ